MTRAAAIAVTLVLGVATPAVAHAQLRLRGDALASTASPTGLLVLQGSDTLRPWLSAEALVWTGAGDDDEADALAIAVWLHDPRGRASLRLGRQVMVVGALRPVHADGAVAQVRLPWRATLEAFGGLPVVPRFGPRAYDWLVGARVGQTLGPVRLGVAWMQRRDHGALDDHELALDTALTPDGPWDAALATAYDLIDPGLAELRLSTAWRRGAWRVELFGSQVSPSRLLPATSLFSVLGDVPAGRAGLSVRWRAAPRLDVWLGGGGTRLDDDVGLDASVRAQLRLDERGDGVLGVELRREGAPDGGWTGARATFRQGLGAGFGLASELELVRPDHQEHGTLWPWGLVAATWTSTGGWQLAGALEASASPSDVYRVDAMARLSRRWELP
jgi:hypothetical protein